MKRKIYDTLIQWKTTSSSTTALLIDGARRVGKSYIAEEFAKENYKSYILIDFNRAGKEVTDLFVNYLDDLDNLFMYLSAYYNTKLFQRDSLITFDEVQLFPRARASIKYLVADGRYDYLETDSLMSIKKNVKKIVIPSEERHINMYPMDFEEFLWAKGYDGSFVSSLLEHMAELKPFTETELAVYRSMFLDYCVLGGMPAVVRDYIVKGTFEGSLETQRQLIADYKEDIHKCAEGIDQTRILNVFNRITPQLARENKKFQISKVASGARFKDYRGCIEWLVDAGMVNICYCMSFPELPLGGNYDDDKYKLYFADTGLLVAMLDEEAQDDLRANKNLGVYKGALYENIVGEALVKSGYSLYYYKREDSVLEEDFFVRTAELLVPVEVKATGGRSKSLRTLIDSERYPDIRCGIKLTGGNIGYSDGIYTFPYFCAFLLKRYLKGNKLMDMNGAAF